MKRSVSKLTAATLKRIIAEEKQKLKKAGIIKESKKKLTESQKIAIFLKLKNTQKRKLREAKKIEAIKRKIKQNILKGK